MIASLGSSLGEVFWIRVGIRRTKNILSSACWIASKVLRRAGETELQPTLGLDQIYFLLLLRVVYESGTDSILGSVLTLAVLG